MGHTGDGIDGGMIGVVGGAVFCGVGDCTDFDGGIHGFHLGIVLREAHGIGPGIVRLVGRIGIAVHLPTAADLVADFPVFKVTMVGDIHHGDSVSGFLGRAAAIVGDDEDLGLRIGGGMD